MKILIAGGGQTAVLVAKRLIKEGNEVVIVEKNSARCEYLEEVLDAQIVVGDAVSIRTLEEAGLQTAEMLIALTSEDQINVIVCLVASIQSNIKVKLVRMRTHEVGDWKNIFDRLGLDIDLIIHPETEIADRILRVVRLPGVSDVIDFAEGKVKLFGMVLQLLIQKQIQ